MVYRFIDKYKDTFGLRWLLKRFKLSSSTYYNYKKNRKAKYYARKKLILDEIRNIYHDCNGVIGYRTMRILLARKGITLSNPTVHKYMNKELQLCAVTSNDKTQKKAKLAYKIFPNLLQQHFHAHSKNHIWCTDFTQIHLHNGTKFYNCSIIDLFDRSVVASVNSRYMNSDLAMRTVTIALENERPEPGLILHSDRGSQFTSIRFNEFCKQHGIIQSMSKAGCPYDNAPMERFYSTFKSEFIRQNAIVTAANLDVMTEYYTFVWYNKIRPHSYNEYLTPYQARNNLQPPHICARLKIE